MNITSSKKKYLALIVFTAYVFLTSCSLLSFHHNHHHMSTIDVSDSCPYVAGGQGLCVNVFDHISGWQHFSNVIVQLAFILFSIVVVSFFYSKPLPLFSRYRLKRIREDYYQSLFSNGLLNPKAP